MSSSRTPTKRPPDLHIKRDADLGAQVADASPCASVRGRHSPDKRYDLDREFEDNTTHTVVARQPLKSHSTTRKGTRRRDKEHEPASGDCVRTSEYFSPSQLDVPDGVEHPEGSVARLNASHPDADSRSHSSISMSTQSYLTFSGASQSLWASDPISERQDIKSMSPPPESLESGSARDSSDAQDEKSPPSDIDPLVAARDLSGRDIFHNMLETLNLLYANQLSMTHVLERLRRDRPPSLELGKLSERLASIEALLQGVNILAQPPGSLHGDREINSEDIPGQDIGGSVVRDDPSPDDVPISQMLPLLLEVLATLKDLLPQVHSINASVIELKCQREKSSAPGRASLPPRSPGQTYWYAKRRPLRHAGSDDRT
ncbi:unnamed protein product [Peniophora sp. CBMAI 1063]|nr:unnamed protein product [Peniophora sp. CBMAI 1063]